MEQKNWIKTEQMLEALKNDPNNEHEYRTLDGWDTLFYTLANI